MDYGYLEGNFMQDLYVPLCGCTNSCINSVVYLRDKVVLRRVKVSATQRRGQCWTGVFVFESSDLGVRYTAIASI